MQREKPPEWWEKQKGSRGIRRGQRYRLVFQFPIREQKMLSNLDISALSEKASRKYFWWSYLILLAHCANRESVQNLLLNRGGVGQARQARQPATLGYIWMPPLRNTASIAKWPHRSDLQLFYHLSVSPEHSHSIVTGHQELYPVPCCHIERKHLRVHLRRADRL